MDLLITLIGLFLIWIIGLGIVLMIGAAMIHHPWTILVLMIIAVSYHYRRTRAQN